MLGIVRSQIQLLHVWRVVSMHNISLHHNNNQRLKSLKIESDAHKQLTDSGKKTSTNYLKSKLKYVFSLLLKTKKDDAALTSYGWQFQFVGAAQRDARYSVLCAKCMDRIASHRLVRQTPTSFRSQ